MVDAELGKSIKQTQDLLGKYVKKPPLSEKNLSRPPFRFLHDVTTSVINGTGFMNGVFDPNELDSNNMSSREAKTEFMRKLITAVNEATGEDVPVKISKVLSGHEPEKTNILLQALARAIQKFKSGNDSKPPAKTTAPTKVKSNEVMGVSKTNADKKSENKPAASTKPDTKNFAGKKPALPPAKKPSGTKAVDTTKTNKKPDGSNRNAGGSSTTTQKKNLDSEQALGGLLQPGRRKSVAEEISEIMGTTNSEGIKESQNLDNVPVVEKFASDSTVANSTSSSLKRQNSSISKVGQVNRDSVKNSSRNELPDDMIPVELNMHERTPANNLNEDTLLLSAPVGQSGDPGHHDKINEDIFSSSAPLENKKPVEVQGTNLEYDEGVQTTKNDQSSSNTVQTRTYAGADRLSSARPPSARPAPPRPKTSLFRDAEESNYRPPTGKVTNVLLDNSDIDEDDNFVVREAAVAQGPGLGGVDETPELALATGIKLDVDSALEELAPEDRGLLVDQILETQRQLENRDGGANKKDLGNDLGIGKSRETSKAEIEKLKNLLQECARNANPLGKLLDYVREDIDAMQKEVAKWREESRSLDSDLLAAKRMAEAALQPIHQELTEVEARVQDKEDAIAATKMSVIRLQERIEKILNGLDRVQSSHGKLPIPSASQLMHNEPSAIKPREDNHFQREGGNAYSSGFSSSINRLAQATPGMRPISLFSSSTDDLDPDNFDPFKK
ncbi:TRAF3-interacting protein 1 isoform X3 [Folsomia candida]|uniref:TRAF3-interacting protein 1 isoform X3 n=1 Tax=Folsomia candida TaxID=158441 RepID=UPI001604FFC6|nr:TRAF3-interacting protein 1 isoform X3 [Folsomia candida]